MTSDTYNLALSHYDELARIGKVLASPVRLRVMDLLRQSPRSVEALAEQAGISIANASQHLQQMRAAHLVESDKQGQHVVYRLANDEISSFFGLLRKLAEARLPELERVRRELFSGSPPASYVELEGRIRRGEVTLLDVRPLEEYRAGHLPGALCIPLPELPERIAELPRDKEVVVYCRGPYCPMAAQAAASLEAAGFKAMHLDLGAPDLSSAGLQLEVAETSSRPKEQRLNRGRTR